MCSALRASATSGTRASSRLSLGNAPGKVRTHHAHGRAELSRERHAGCAWLCNSRRSVRTLPSAPRDGGKMCERRARVLYDLWPPPVAALVASSSHCFGRRSAVGGRIIFGPLQSQHSSLRSSHCFGRRSAVGGRSGGSFRAQVWGTGRGRAAWAAAAGISRQRGDCAACHASSHVRPMSLSMRNSSVQRSTRWASTHRDP